jgi:phosphate transport system protein
MGLETAATDGEEGLNALAARTVKVFDEELDQLRAAVAEMGGRVESAIGEAVVALATRNLDAAARIAAGDLRIDAMSSAIARQALCLIALRAPCADDLRDILGALRIAEAIEGMGDSARNISIRAKSLSCAGNSEQIQMLSGMEGSVSEVVKTALDAFIARDAQAAERAARAATGIASFYDSVFRSLVSYMTARPSSITVCTHLLMVAQDMERIGVNASDIARHVFFAATGARLGERSENDYRSRGEGDE